MVENVPTSPLSKADDPALDHPIWSALTGGHKEIALGGDLARRYESNIAQLGAMRETTPQGFDALTSLIPEDGQIVLLTLDKIASRPPAAR